MRRAVVLVSLFLSFSSLPNLASAQTPTKSPGLDVVGFGYDVFGRYADMASKKPRRLFALGKDRVEPIGSSSFLVPEGIFLEPVVDHRVTTVEGSSVRQYARSLAVNAGLKFDGLFFKGSVETNIDSSQSGSTSRHYFTYMDSNNMWRISLDTVDIDRLRKTLVPSVRNDINTLAPDKLFEAYGTHYIASAYLGGRSDYSAVSVVSERVTADMIRIAVQAEYKAISGSGEVSKEQRKVMQDSETKTQLRVVGGNAQYVNNIRDYAQYTKWADGIESRPVLCDFDDKSLRPVWELADSPARRQLLENAFQKLLKQYPLPPELANLGAMRAALYMVESKGTGTYWDLPGYHMSAKSKGEALGLYREDRISEAFEGADRFIKVIPNTVEEGWVFLQPQHSEYVVDIRGGVKTPGAVAQLADLKKTNHSVQFMLKPAADEKDTYFVESRLSGLCLEASPDGKAVVQQPCNASERQKWVFKATNPVTHMAPPAPGTYTVRAVAGGKRRDFAGTYPGIFHGKLSVCDYAPNPRSADRQFVIAKVEGEWHTIQPRHLPNHVLEGPSKSNIVAALNKKSHEQLWRFEYGGAPNTFHVRNRRTNEVIDVNFENSNVNGADVNSWGFHGGDNQKFVFEPVSNLEPALTEGTFHVRLKGTDKYLDLSGDDRESNKNGANVQVWAMDGGKDRLVRFVPLDAGNGVLVQFQNGGRMLECQGKGDKGANVRTWERTGKDNQHWVILPHGSNSTFVFQSLSGTSRVLDISDGELKKKGNGANAQVWDRHNGPNQLFELVYADGPKKGQLFVGE